MDIFAVPVPEGEDYLKNHPVDVVFLGPQVRYLPNNFQQDSDIAVEVIPMTDYGMMKGNNVLALAESLIK